jgi:hypothetical protein
MTDALGLGTALVAVFFLGMGVFGLGMPARILVPFGTTGLTIDGRNEVRAVYGGFGIAIGVLLIATAGVPALRAGVLAAVATALLGMAGGRVVSAAIERPSRFYPCWFYLLAEAGMAVVLLAAI